MITIVIFFVISDITSILKETPTPSELSYLLSDIRGKWYEIGLSLQVCRNVLEDLKHSPDNDQRKLMNVINMWLNSQSSVTWETLITAMKSPVVNKKAIANKIHQYLSAGKFNKYYY